MHTPSLPDTSAGAAVYSALVLRFYDAWVLGFSNRWAWGRPTRSVLLPFYRQHVGRRHLEVGVGTGWYLARAGLDRKDTLTLFDLNRHSLRAAGRRAAVDADMIVGDAMAPGAALAGRSFDAIALFYLLHCLPGDMAGKAAVFAAMSAHLDADGVLYGATILGDSAGHNRIGRALMHLYHRKGIFGNRDDTAAGLEAALARHFRFVEIVRHGRVALFTARGPRR